MGKFCITSQYSRTWLLLFLPQCQVTLVEKALLDLADASILAEFTSESIRAKVQQICIKDRWVAARFSTSTTLAFFLFRLLYEKSIKAFVSFAQFYRKHDCSLLFKTQGRWCFFFFHKTASTVSHLHLPCYLPSTACDFLNVRHLEITGPTSLKQKEDAAH